MFRHCLLSLTLATLAVTVSGAAHAGIVTYGGDAIGDDSSDTDGLGVFGAMLVGNDPSWGWQRNAGAPAFQYNSDGKATLNSLRAVTSVYRRTTDPANWDKQNWSVDVWRKSDYLAKGAPIHTVNMGATPSNWSGFKTLPNGDVVPDTTPFGTPGGQTPAGTRSYEMVFDLSQHAPLQNPLPTGEYIISLTSRGEAESIGDATLGYSWRGQGPDAYFSLDFGGSIQPGPVVGRLTSNEDFRWAMNLDIRSDLLNGSFEEGLTHWETSGPGTVEIIEVNGDSLAKFTAGSPAILSQSLITDSELYNFSFDYKFDQPFGTLDVLLGDDLLTSLRGDQLFSSDFSMFSMNIDEPLFFGRQDDLTFRFDGNTGDTFWLNNVRMGITAVPEPSSLALLSAISGGMLLYRRRRAEAK